MNKKRPDQHSSPWAFTFILSGLAALVLVALATLVAGPRTTMGSTGVLLAIVFLWPFLLILIGLLLTLLMAVLGESAPAGEAAEVGVTGGLWYYRRLVSTRSPALWGGLLGAAIAAGALYAYVEFGIAPKEAQTLKQVQALVKVFRVQQKQTGHFPEPKGDYLYEALGLSPDDTWHGISMKDAWGKPFFYEHTRGKWTQRFTVISGGWDGQKDKSDLSGDDIRAKGSAFEKGAVKRQITEYGKKKAGELLRNLLKKGGN
jgi:Type II secretion system (T2SS), protein G